MDHFIKFQFNSVLQKKYLAKVNLKMETESGISTNLLCMLDKCTKLYNGVKVLTVCV